MFVNNIKHQNTKIANELAKRGGRRPNTKGKGKTLTSDFELGIYRSFASEEEVSKFAFMKLGEMAEEIDKILRDAESRTPK